MDKLVIEGGHSLNGTVSISGAKNSCLPILFSTLLCDGTHVFRNVPRLRDVYSSLDLLKTLGCQSSWDGDVLKIEVSPSEDCVAPYDQVRKMRASILCLGPLLARYGQARVSLPGGCAIGTRPIDLHLDGLKQLGAEVETDRGYVLSNVPGGKLTAATLVFDQATVGGTENLMMAAVLADGETILENAAKEPEIVDLANYLRAMGAQIEGDGTGVIRIQGVSELKPAEHEIIPDRIEAGTMLIAGALCGEQVTVNECVPAHVDSLLQKFQEAGIKYEVGAKDVTIYGGKEFQAVDVTTAPHPLFPTDLQAQFMTLMTQAQGTSIISETVFENRFMHVQELVRLNANITPKTKVAVVRGPTQLIGAPVMATDLRASASLALAGLVARGETEVKRIYHLDRGYEQLEVKLGGLGAKMKRVKE